MIVCIHFFKKDVPQNQAISSQSNAHRFHLSQSMPTLQLHAESANKSVAHYSPYETLASSSIDNFSTVNTKTTEMRKNETDNGSECLMFEDKSLLRVISHPHINAKNLGNMMASSGL